ncbi:predicted protein [Chaetomium globosum CBS 148.51]|jgi:hypothetical protein|uniref:Uncharacterized protein n=1 Tax=Chaetomium globosum (strain ATCC 6205 / CBS 148.51 / DSM 1962 / NBRC 6347 / NRRL 1970) TaxID=306901 RepID=Q2H628_CHAGB|nr:uncharacterized protein CHGG_05887 [Chaetomium globosum CBS 148.51]EAQ89268.1 predicted protein [Chaetomium globosum CBS 148.51]
MEQGQRIGTHKAPKPHHPHHVVPKHESGYTDEAAEECHDLIDKAEEDAHLHDPDSMYSTTDKPEHVHRAKGKGGLEGSGSTGKGTSQKIQETGKNVTESIGETMGEMKQKMGMGK